MIKLLLFTFLLIQTVILHSQDIVKNKIDSFLANDSQVDISVLIYDPISMDTIYAKDIFNNLIPASNVKLYTVAAALNILGDKDYLYTKVYSDDDIFSDSIINGNLFIKGFGDAQFTDKNLRQLVDDIYESGIRQIDGNIFADETYFDKVYTRDDWIVDERANVKLPPISGLSLNRNQIVVKFFTNGQVGNSPSYEIEPSGDFYNATINAKITSSRSVPRINFKTSGENITVQISGGIQKRRNPYSYFVNPDSPAVFIANLFRYMLQKKGISIKGKAYAGRTPSSVIEIASFQNSLMDLVDRVNKKSDNYLAENLFKIIGAEFSGKEGNSFYATQAVISILEHYDIFYKGIDIVDGSGISRFNRVSTASIVSLLEYVYLDIANFDFYFNSLAIAGEDGTLQDRFYQTSAYKNFRGKTGSLNGVSSLSGYLTTKNNRDLIVSIIMNFKSKGQNYYRGLQDKIITYLAENL
ncbi:d-alanyl-d-alanine carboxypeptidase [hydrocarbon metagenome]|uniref:D-alanyl-d-alanine carboxypeptidase n=1 Tax=hydrocarbon metagenome TaxID=938273 RepID=A0A0W8FXV1_9ZZZZ